ncbi:JAB domain-containing protein [Aureibaculum algae]|uniref:JAB domain-containing protein n=1 Tax=Aureibaculum algae TaxID=2584122 RepID=UPI0037431F4B
MNKVKINEIRISYIERNTTLNSKAITGSVEARNLLFDNWDKNTIALHETFKVLLLNNSNKVKGVYELSNGGITGTLVDICILFAIVLKSLSVGIIVAHNHPSGSLKASEADIQLTQKIKTAATLLDVKVLDHVIISPSGQFYSFADNNML